MGQKTIVKNRSLIKSDLELNLKNSDWNKLVKNLDIALQYGVSKRLRKKVALELGHHYVKRGDYLRAFSAFENALVASPDQRGIIIDELKIIENILEDFGDELSHDDLVLLSGLMELLLQPLLKKKFIPSINKLSKLPIEVDLRNRINNRLDEVPNRIFPEIPPKRNPGVPNKSHPKNPKKKKTKISVLIAQFFDALNPDLTPEQRWDKVTKILAPHILRSIEKQRKQIEKDARPSKPPIKPVFPKTPTIKP